MAKTTPKAPKRKGSLAARSGPAMEGDARLRIINKNRSKVVDARDKLVKLAKKSDAREKLEKIRNLKSGKVSVKTTRGGAVTIVQTTKGETVLTTKRRSNKGAASRATKGSRNASDQRYSGAVERRSRLNLTTKPKTQSTLVGVARSKPKQNRPTGGRSSDPLAVPSASRRHSSHADVISNLKRTVRQDVAAGRMTVRDEPREDRYRHGDRSMDFHYRPPAVRRSLDYQDRLRMDSYRIRRSRSPMDIIDVDRYQERDDYIRRTIPSDRHTSNGSRYHYDDPRRELEREEEMFRRVRQQEQQRNIDDGYSRTMADRVEPGGVSRVSPLQGTKVAVSNLQSSVSQDDIMELFGDIGALKRVKVSTPGMAEVVFVNRSDALKAVEIYHNRQLDGKAMKCQVVGINEGYVGRTLHGGYK